MCEEVNLTPLALKADPGITGTKNRFKLWIFNKEIIKEDNKTSRAQQPPYINSVIKNQRTHSSL